MPSPGAHTHRKWYTYNTPMNGTRIAFHVCEMAGTNALSRLLPVNGPRFRHDRRMGRDARGRRVSSQYFGPMREVALADGTPVVIEENTDYPIGDAVRLKITPQAAKRSYAGVADSGMVDEDRGLAERSADIQGQAGRVPEADAFVASRRRGHAAFGPLTRYESGDLGKLATYRYIAGRFFLHRRPLQGRATSSG